MSDKTIRYLLYGTTLLMLCPFYINVPYLLLVFGILFFKDWRGSLVAWRSNTDLNLLTLFGVGVSLYYQNYSGACIALGINFLLFFFRLMAKHLNLDTYRSHLKLMAVGSSGVALDSLRRYVSFVREEGHSFLYIIQEASPRFRAEATFFNANYYVLFCIFAILLSVYFLHHAKDWLKKLSWLLVIGLNLLGIILTASRMVWVALAVALLVYLYILYRRYFKWGIVMAALGAGLLWLKPDLLPRFSSLAYAFEDRRVLWEAGWQIFNFSPLTGRGPLCFIQYYYLLDVKAAPHAHNLLINLLADYGLIGVTLWVQTLTPYLRRLFAAFKQHPQARDQLGLLLAVLVAILVHGVTDVSILWVQTLYFACLIACHPLVLEASEC